MNRIQMKAAAKQQIKGNIGILFLMSLVIALISSAVNGVPGVGSLAVVLVIFPAFSLAMVKVYLGLTHGEKPVFGKIFESFREFWPAFKVTFLTGLFTFLWSLLLIVPGIIKGISYSQALYILAENPEIGAREAISRSKQMMHGHKMDYFVLCLSFIGWAFLVPLTLGLIYIWLHPYIATTFANFYNSIKEQPAE